MLFSTDQLYKRENIIDNTPKQNHIVLVSENTSIIINSLKYILEENILIENELTKYAVPAFKNRSSLLMNINESDEDDDLSDILKPEFTIRGKFAVFNRQKPNIFEKIKTNFSLSKIVKAIINGFIAILTKLFRQFNIICMNLVSKSSQIRRYESKIKNLGVAIPYDGPIFTFTHIIDSTNRVELDEILREIYEEASEFMKKVSKNLKNTREIEIITNEFRQKAAMNDDKYNSIRGNVLKGDPISADKFNEELFRYFRNGSSIATVDNMITPDQIRQRLESYNIASKNKIVQGYEKDKAKLEKAGRDFVAKIEASKLNDEIPAAQLELYTEIINNYTHKIKNVCDIFVLYYAHKLEAAKDELSTNTKILFKAAEYIVKEGL